MLFSILPRFDASRPKEKSFSGELQFRTFLNYKLCKFLTQSVDLYNEHLKFDRHFYTFGENDLKLVCTFWRLEQEASNVKRRS